MMPQLVPLQHQFGPGPAPYIATVPMPGPFIMGAQNPVPHMTPGYGPGIPHQPTASGSAFPRPPRYRHGSKFTSLRNDKLYQKKNVKSNPLLSTFLSLRKKTCRFLDVPHGPRGPEPNMAHNVAGSPLLQFCNRIFLL